MNLEDLEKQLQELQQIDTSILTPEQLQELIDKLASITDIGEKMLQEFENEELDYDNYLPDINDENESYDENNS